MHHPDRIIRAGLRRVVLVGGLALLAGCLSSSQSTVCRPRAGLYCLTSVVCAVDRQAGCEVCRCSDAPFVPLGSPDGRPPR